MGNELDNHAKAYFGEIIYDFDNGIQLRWYPKRIAEYAPHATSLLELGLGHGITSDFFGKKFRRHVVIDASSAVIANFKQRFPESNTEIVESYFETFETEERFDVIVFGYILEHVDDPVQILRHFRKFMAPRGRMFVIVPNAEVMNRRLGHLAGMLADIEELSGHDHLLGHKRYFTVKTLRQTIEDAGYRVTRMEGVYLKPLTTRQMISLELDERVIDAFCQLAVDYPELSCSILAELDTPAL